MQRLENLYLDDGSTQAELRGVKRMLLFSTFFVSTGCNEPQVFQRSPM